MPPGIILNRDLSRVYPIDQRKITESVAHSWYEGEAAGVHPYDETTEARYTGPAPPYEMLDTSGKYSWSKSPRYDGRPMETGPLAAILVAYAAGHPGAKGAVDMVLGKLGAGPDALFSTLGRTAARGIETLLVARELSTWLDMLVANIAGGDLTIHNGEKWDPATWPREAAGYGWHNAPRGALGHWVRIKDQKIENYQAVVPSTWNASPRDEKGQQGPYEAALVGTPLADPGRPLEILRTIHSFDPCLACAVHVVDPQGGELVSVKVL